MSAPKPPVVVSINVEGFGGSESDLVEFPREEWEAKTPAERTKMIEGVAADFAANYVGWGWHIEDPKDYAATGAAS